MTRTEAEANYKAAKDALDAFFQTEQKSRDDYHAGDIEWEERKVVKVQYDALMELFDEAFAVMASFPEEDETTEEEDNDQLEFAF